MSALIIVDTDMLMDVARHVSEAVGRLDAIEEQSALGVSVITQMELVVGCRNKADLRKTDRFLRRFQVLGLSEAVSHAAVGLLRRYRLSHGLAMPDALIAATAMAWNRPLITKNQRDYRFIEGLQLVPYP